MSDTVETAPLAVPRDWSVEARARRAQTVMGTAPERHVFLVVPPDVEVIGIREPLRISIGCVEQAEDRGGGR